MPFCHPRPTMIKMIYVCIYQGRKQGAKPVGGVDTMGSGKKKTDADILVRFYPFQNDPGPAKTQISLCIQ